MLKGIVYSRDSSIDLSMVTTGNNALRCLTPLVQCCENDDAGVSGSWRFPNGNSVSNQTTGNLYFTKEPSSIVLHQMTTTQTVSGIYTCEIPDANGALMQLDAHLYTGGQPGKRMMYVCVCVYVCMYVCMYVCI